MEINCDISLKIWLTRKEAAAYLGYSVKYIDNERKAGKISYLEQKGANKLPSIRFERVELDKYMRRNYKEIKSVDASTTSTSSVSRRRHSQF